MNTLTPILTITGSDSTGGTGIQQDIKTITALGGYALTAITSITLQDDQHINHVYDIPRHVVISQTESIINTHHPKAIKMGMIRDVETIVQLRKEIVGCPQIVEVPGILSSKGEYLMSMEAIEAWKRHLIPIARLLILKCNEAEVVLGMHISTSEAMIKAARKLCDMGADSVLLRGGHIQSNTLTALLYHGGYQQFFSSQNTSGWQKHGVGAALSTAIATRLGMGDSISKAVHIAHNYMHTQVIYTVTAGDGNARPVDLYNVFMDMVVDNFHQHHEVSYYAERMNIGTRYLSQITNKVVNKSPKQIITEYLMEEAKQLLQTTFRPIQDIAYSLGFTSQAQFTKAFVLQFGKTPSELRKG